MFKYRINIKITTILIGLAGYSVFGQQLPQFSLYSFSPITSNPAYSGSLDALELTALLRSQWTGFKGAPQTVTINGHTPLKNQRIALGASLIADRTGATSTSSFSGNAAYRLVYNGSDDFLAFGLTAVVDLFQGDYNGLNVVDPTDPLYYTSFSQVVPNISSGLLWQKKRFFIGLSGLNLIEHKSDFTVKNRVLQNDRHFFLTAGYAFKLNSILDLRVEGLAKTTVNTPLSFDVDMAVFYRKQLFIGAFYRGGFGGGGYVKYQMSNSKLAFGYSYDHTTNGLAQAESGSHEILVQYGLFNKLKGIRTPRFF